MGSFSVHQHNQFRVQFEFLDHNQPNRHHRATTRQLKNESELADSMIPLSEGTREEAEDFAVRLSKELTSELKPEEYEELVAFGSLDVRFTRRLPPVSLLI